MKKIKPEIKNKYTLKMQDKIDAIETIASVFFRDVEDEHGNVEEKYTPYLEEIGQVTAIAKYLISGLEFEKNEDVHSAVINDVDIRPMVDKFMIPYGTKIDEPTEEQKIFGQIMDKVYDIVEYKKAMKIDNQKNDVDILLKFKMINLVEKEEEKNTKEIDVLNNLNEWLESQKRISSGITREDYEKFVKSFDVSSMTEAFIESYGESELHKKNREIVDANRKIREKENKIIELQTAYAKEQQKDNTKNVVADKPKRGRKKKTEITTEVK